MQQLFLLLFLAAIQAISRGGIVITPADSGANVGNSFTFNCTLTDEVESEQLFLAINGELEGEDFNRTSSVIDPPGSVTYTFNGVSLSDQGTIFQCLTSRQSSKLLSLIVYFPPSYTLSSSYLSLFNGSSGCINISIQALPYPFNYSWTHGTEFLAVVPPTHLMTTAHSICFDPVLQSDNGTYTVISTNKAGNGSISFNLNVFYGPTFLEGSNDTKWVEFAIGSNFTLQCTVMAANPPSYNISLINSSLVTDNVDANVSGSTARFVFTDVSVDNGGNYTCQAAGNYSTTNLTYWLFIGGPPLVSIQDVNISINYYSLLIDIQLTDTGSAPATGLSFNITSNHTNGKNYTVSLDYPIINSTRIIKGLLITSYDELYELVTAAGSEVLLLSIGAFNDIGHVKELYNTSFSVTAYSSSFSFTSVEFTSFMSLSTSLTSTITSMTSSTTSSTTSSMTSTTTSSTTSVTSVTSSSSTATTTSESLPTSSFHQASPSPSPPHTAPSSKGGVIAAAVIVPFVALLVGVAIVVAVVICIYKRRSKKLAVLNHDYNYEQIVDGSSYESFMTGPEHD